jgi:hypothetical protein
MIKMSLKDRHGRHRQYYLPSALFGLAVVMIIISIILLSHFGSAAYFALTGKPYHWGGGIRSSVSAQSLPHIRLSGAVSDAELSVGDTQAIIITADADKDTTGTLKVWVESPTHSKQVWQSPPGEAADFPANRTITKKYTYQIKPVAPKSGLSPSYALPSGVYTVSAIITSPDGYTDYVSTKNIAEFTLK